MKSLLTAGLCLTLACLAFALSGCLIKSEATIKTTSKIESDSHITIHRPDKRRPRVPQRPPRDGS